MSASKKNGIVVAAALSIIFFAACDNSFDLLGKATDDVFVANNRYLKVVSTVPAPNSHDVFPQDPLRIIFDRAVSSPESLNGRVLITVGGTAVDTSVWTFSYDMGTFTLSITPSGALLSESSVSVSIPLGITGQDGSRLREAYTWSYFTNNGVVTDPLAPPAPEGMDLSADDDTGPSNADNVTNKTQGLTVFGTAAVSTPVRVMEGQSLLAATASDTTGRWTVELSLSEGAHSLSAIAVKEETHASPASTPFILTVDTTAPAAASAPDLIAADDTGDSDSDNLTCLTSGITVTGTGEAGSLVTIMSGSTVAGTTTVAAGGTWSADLSLGNGSYALTSVASDLAGNTVGSMGVLAITVDTSAIVAPSMPDLDVADDTGELNNDKITKNVSDLTISGTNNVLAGRPIVLKEGSTVLGSCTAKPTNPNLGFWTVDLTLAEGTHIIQAYSYSQAGVESTASNGLTLVVDQTPPAKPIAPDLAVADDTGGSNTDNVTQNLTDLTILGNVEGNSTIHLIMNTNEIYSYKTDATGTWATDLPLQPSGTHTYYLTAYTIDIAGNQSSDSEVMTLVVDNTAPSIASLSSMKLAAEDDSGTSNTDRITNHSTGLTITGTFEPFATIKLDDTGPLLGTAFADGSGAWTMAINLSTGGVFDSASGGYQHYFIGVTETDLAGNWVRVTYAPDGSSFGILVDTAPPSAPGWLQTPDSTYSVGDYTWRFNAPKYDLSRKISGNWVTIDSSSTKSQSWVFYHVDYAGDYRMMIWDVDTAGNVSSPEVSAITTFQ